VLADAVTLMRTFEAGLIPPVLKVWVLGSVDVISAVTDVELVDARMPP